MKSNSGKMSNDENSNKKIVMRPEQRRLFRCLQVTGMTPFTIKHGFLTYVQAMLKMVDLPTMAKNNKFLIVDLDGHIHRLGISYSYQL